jgi:hypothetical protein
MSISSALGPPSPAKLLKILVNIWLRQTPRHLFGVILRGRKWLRKFAARVKKSEAMWGKGGDRKAHSVWSKGRWLMMAEDWMRMAEFASG